MKSQINRLLFYLSDLMIISGKSEKTCRRKIEEMKRFFNLKAHQDLTFPLVAEYTGIPEETLYQRLLPKKK